MHGPGLHPRSAYLGLAKYLFVENDLALCRCKFVGRIALVLKSASSRERGLDCSHYSSI